MRHCRAFFTRRRHQTHGGGEGKKKFAFSREFGRYPLSKYVGALKQLIAEYPTTDNPKINGFRRDERGVFRAIGISVEISVSNAVDFFTVV